MKPVEWYHAKDNKQYGPVSTAELKQLAQTGSLQPDDLVWREGMKGWVPAREVKGLFDDASPSPSGPAKVVSAPAAAPAKPANGGAPPGEKPAAKPSAEKPAVDKPAVDKPAVEKPAVEKPAVEKPVVQKTPADDRPLLAVLLDVARGQFTPSFLHSASRLFALGGHYALYGVMLVAVLFFAAVGIQTGNLPRIFIGLGAALVLVVLQYAAVRFHETIEPSTRTGESRLASTALPDSFALLSIAAGMAALVWFTLQAVTLADYWALLEGLGAFIVCEYAAFVAVNPAWLGMTVVPGTRPSEEALGLLTFLLKTALGCVPVAFGVGAIDGLLRLLYACCLLFTGPAEAAEAQALEAVLRVVCLAALPFAGYLVFILGSLVVDALRGLVSLGDASGGGKWP